MIQWVVQGTNQTVGEDLPAWVHAGWLHPQAPVSADGGRTWIPAVEAARRLVARGDDAMAFLVPMRTSTYATVAQYIGLFSLLFFGGPLCAIAAAIAWDPAKTTIGFRLGFIATALVLGPLPVLLPVFLGHREIKKDPTLRGNFRLIFGAGCGGLMALAVLGALVGLVVR